MKDESITDNNELYGKVTNIIMYNELQLKLLDTAAAKRHIIKSLPEIAQITVSLRDTGLSENETTPILDKLKAYIGLFTADEVKDCLAVLHNNGIFF